MMYSLIISVSFLLALSNAFTASTMNHRQNSRTVHSSEKSENNAEKTDNSEALTKATKSMTAFTNKYLQISDTRLCSDSTVAAVVIQGLAEHKVELGAPLCPCRFYDDKQAEAKDGYWNCPCVPMRERNECHCMLFLTPDNDFAGTEQEITYDQVIEGAHGMKD